MSTLKLYDSTIATVDHTHLIEELSTPKASITQAICDPIGVNKNFESPSPIDSLHERLAQYTKIAQEHIAKALAPSPDHTQASGALKLSLCGRYATTRGDLIRPLDRCHRRSCPVCALIKGAQTTKRIKRALNQLKFQFIDEAPETLPTDRRMIAIKVTLNGGESCTFDHLKTRIKTLHKIWARLLNTRIIGNHLIGALRATEITQTNLDHAHPHIHALLLMRADTNLTEVSKAIHHYWPKAIKREVIRTEKNRSHSAQASVNNISYPASQTIYDVSGWVKYITKGSYDFNNAKHREEHALTSYNYWVSVDQAIKGMRMISLSGDLKEALILVKSQEAEERAKRPDEPISRDTMPTLGWSNVRQRYVPLDQIKSNEINYAPLSQSFSYMTPPMHFGLIAQHEISDKLTAEKIRQIEELRKRVLNSGDHLAFNLINELFTYNSSKVKTDESLERFEAPEIERSSLVKRLEERKLAENADQDDNHDEEEKSS